MYKGTEWNEIGWGLATIGCFVASMGFGGGGNTVAGWFCLVAALVCGVCLLRTALANEDRDE